MTTYLDLAILAVGLLSIINLRHIVKNRRQIIELRKYVAGLVTAKVLEQHIAEEAGDFLEKIKDLEE